MPLNRSLFSTDDPNIDVEAPDIADLDREDLDRFQAEYDNVKATNTVLKSKCTKLWKLVLPHLDIETGYFKEGIGDAQRAACIENNAIRAFRLVCRQDCICNLWHSIVVVKAHLTTGTITI